MPPRGRKRKSGHMREDAARDHMRDYGFQESVINESIKELLEVYGDGQWFFIEDGSYASLLATCLEKQEKINNQVVGNQDDEMDEALNDEMADEEQPNQLAGEEQNNQLAGEVEEEEMEQDRHVVDEKDQADEPSITTVTDPSPAAFHLGEASTDYAPNSVEGNITVALHEEMAGEEQNNQLAGEEQKDEREQDRHVEGGRDQVNELSITNEAVTDPSPAAFHLGGTTGDYAPNPVEGAENRHCGWLSSEDDEETNPKEDSDGDDDEMIQLTPEPLCEELEELLREVRGQTKRKKETRWDK